jgi:sugar phosphate isomerase/epimerase
VDVAIICGGREYRDRQAIRAFLRTLDRTSVVIMTGGQDGADKLADAEAERLGFDRLVVPPNWIGNPGRSGGFRRNQRMLTYARAIARELGGRVGVFAFPGNVGTRGMLKLARDAGVHWRTVGWELD